MKTNIKNKKDFFIILILFFIILFISFIVSICVGSQKISFENFLQIIGLKNSEPSDVKILMQKNILTQIRFPRSLLVMFSGFVLAGSGCVFQGFFRNSLAEPGILGISSGATLGAVLSLLLPTFFTFKFIQPIALFAFLGAIFSGIIIFLLSLKSNSFTSSSSVILTGTALGTFFSSITSIILLSKQNQLHSICGRWFLHRVHSHPCRKPLPDLESLHAEVLQNDKALYHLLIRLIYMGHLCGNI